MRSPSPDLLQLGRGIVRWAPIVNGVRGNWLDMGNVESLSLATADTKLTKKSSRVAANVIYKEITSEREVTVTIQGDEFNTDVLSAMLQGDIEAVDASMGGNETAEDHGIPGELDCLLKLAHPLVSNVVVSDSTPTVGVEGTDFEVIDAVRGFVRLIPASEGGGLDPAETITVAYDWDVEVAHQRIRGGTQSVFEASIRFAADNAQGPSRDAEFYRVSLTADGDLGLIQQGDLGTWTLKAKLLDDSAGRFGGSVSSPFYKLTDPPTAA